MNLWNLYHAYIVLWFQMAFMMCGVVIGSCKLVLINSTWINGYKRGDEIGSIANWR